MMTAVLSAIGLLLIFAISCVRMNNQYVQSVMLSFGKFNRIQGSGFYLTFPIVMSIEKAIDTRLRTSILTSEKALTSNGIPLDITLFFQWQVYDAEKAVLEIEDYEEAVFSIAHTTMRERIGEMTTNDLLVNRHNFTEKLQEDLKIKTNEWGIEVKRIEVQDILVPAEIQTLMSQQERATREADANLTLANNAKEIASINADIAKIYNTDPKAWEIRCLDALIEISANGKALIIPSGLPGMIDTATAATTAETQKLLGKS